MRSVPSSAEIDAAARELGLADEHGRCFPSQRSRAAKHAATIADQQAVDVEDLHEVVARFDKNLADTGVTDVVRAAAVGALVANITSPSNIDTDL